jgi:hypothetical protein
MPYMTGVMSEIEKALFFSSFRLSFCINVL